MQKLTAQISSLKGAFIFPLVLLMLAVVLVGCGQSNSTSPESTSNPSSTTADKAKPVKVDDNAIAQNECSQCHEMWPEIATWQTSVHEKIACSKCHTNLDNGAMKSAHDSKSFAKPIVLKSSKVESTVCTDCHAMANRDVTPMPDLIIPHDKHAKAGVDCLSCHKYIAHGNLGERKVTNRPEYSDYDKWDVQLAKKAAPGVMRRPNMFVCINCHEARKVTTKCSVCHYWPDRATLPSHEVSDWSVNHGKTGRADVNNCAKCHYDKESQKFITPSTGDKIADFARANTYCYNCHLKRPASHDAQWMGKHANFASKNGLLNCFACHDKNQPGANVTGTYCNTCHWFPATFGAQTSAKK